MKRLPLLFVFSLISGLAVSIGARSGENTALRFELTMPELEKLEDSPVWDFSGCSTVDDNAKACVRKSKGVIYESAFGPCHAYLEIGDSIFYRGFNIGRNERMLVRDTVCVARRPFVAGETLESFFRGEGLTYGKDTALVSGYVRTEVLGRGTFISASDTVRGACLIKEYMKMDFAESDTVAPFRSDSTVVYRWFGGDRGDVLAIAKTGMSAWDGRSRFFMAERFYVEDDDAKDVETVPAEALQSFLESASVHVGEGDVTVEFSSAPTSFQLNAFIMDLSGNIYSSRRIAVGAGEEVSFTIPSTGAPYGRNILSLSVEGLEGVNHKFFVEL